MDINNNNNNLTSSAALFLNNFRRRSVSLNHIPTQNENYLHVPATSNSLPECSNSTSQLKTNIEFDINKSLKKIESVTLITIPDNFKFAEVEIKLHRSRWILMTLCVVFTSISYMQWIQFSIITNLIMNFYNISSQSVDWTSLIFMITYVILVLPVSYWLENKSLRRITIYGCFGTALGAWIKIFALEPNRFYVLLLGQFIVAFSQIIILIVPIKLSTIWFGSDELFTVSGISAFGIQLGVALGFFITPWISQEHKNLEDIRDGLHNLTIFTAGVSTVVACIAFIMFKEQPKYPPSTVQAITRSSPKLDRNKDNWINLESLKDKNLLRILVAYGINTGVLNSFSTLLNQIILDYFPNGEQDAGHVGVFMIVSGLFGSFLFAIIMDSTQKFKETALWVSRFSVIGMLFFCFALESKSKILLFVSSAVLGFFMTGYQTVGHELALEVIFPYSESSLNAFLHISAHVFGTILTLMFSYIEMCLGNRMEHFSFIVLLIVGTIILTGTKFEQNRTLAHKEVDTEVEKLAELELLPNNNFLQ